MSLITALVALIQRLNSPFFGADTFLLHCSDGCSLCEWWEVNPRPAVHSCGGRYEHPDLSPQTWRCTSPAHASRQCSSVSGLPQSVVGTALNTYLPFAYSNTVALLVQHIFSPLFYAPCAVLLHWSNRAEKVKMGIGCAAVLTLLFVKGHINGHAPADKLPKQKFPCQSDVFFKEKIHSARKFQNCMQAGRSYHARLFQLRSIGSDGLRILSVHGAAGECQSR